MMGTENAFQTFTLSKLVAQYPGGIRIPMIQRDYAQGRASWQNPRTRFLKSLEEALSGVTPLHLDFIYGIRRAEDGIDAFSPLDGQQRLTTLFLLHWYLAARDDSFREFQRVFRTDARGPRFTYQVRPGGSSFFRCLVNHAPESGEAWKSEPSAWIEEQPWFRTAWRRDPTVTGGLTMLDAIALVFSVSKACYEHLASGDRITFEVLDLEAAGLHDDLYLRMNARGRPLTPFETFKARFEKHLEKTFAFPSRLSRCDVQSALDFSRKIDNEWLDFIWDRYGPKSAESGDTGSVDRAFMNLFRAVALVSLPPKERKPRTAPDVVTALLADPDFDDFENGDWLSGEFTVHLIHVMEACERFQENGSLLLQERWFEKGPLLDRVLRHDGKPDFTDYLQFAACVRFVARHGPVLDHDHLIRFGEWMRVVRNLVLNTELRADNFQECLAGLDQLLNGGDDILSFLSTADKVSGFNEQQLPEERLKASLIRSENAWRQLIESAENHGYFRGQIGFLLEFSGADPTAPVQSPALEDFKTYWRRAQEMFGPAGLNAKPDYLWERALLAVGDYLLPHGGESWSFLRDDRDNPVSWKRLLKELHDGRRAHLKTLWDRMANKETLEQIAAALPVEPWRRALCSTPAAWDYCGQRLIRFEVRGGESPRVFLLSGQRRSAAYTELFTYCLLKQGAIEDDSGQSRFVPLKFKDLVQHTGSEDDPHLRFDFPFQGKTHEFLLYCQYKDDKGFSLWIADKDLNSPLLASLTEFGFKAETGFNYLAHRQDSTDPLDGAAFLRSIAEKLRSLA